MLKPLLLLYSYIRCALTAKDANFHCRPNPIVHCWQGVVQSPRSCGAGAPARGFVKPTEPGVTLANHAGEGARATQAAAISGFFPARDPAILLSLRPRANAWRYQL
jgi:hypothetical protein